MRYAIIDKRIGKVVNAIEYDAPPSDPPPGMSADYIARTAARFDIGWNWVGGVLVDPAPPATPDAPLPDLSNMDNLPKAIRAVMLVMATWNGKTVPQAKAAFKAAWDSLP